MNNSTDTVLAVAPIDQRRIDLDWVRIIAFALLIWYHVTSFYAAGTPHNQALSPRAYAWLIVPMLALSPWRLLILFTVSGAATRFMADKMKPAALLRTRTARLLLPLLFVSAIIVPPIAFVTVSEWSDYQGSFVSYLGHYFTADRSVCHDASCPPVPNYFHLWFVAYLWNYTILLTGLLAWAPWVLRALQRGLERASRGWGLIVWPVAYLALARFALQGRFPQTLDLIHDWYNHAIYLGGFLLGFSLAKSDAIWAAFERIRARTLFGALLTYAVMITLGIIVLGADFNWAKPALGAPSAHQMLLRALAAVLWGFDQWLWIAAAFGFAHRYLAERDGPARRYLTDAIFPFYIIHMLTIVGGGYYLSMLGLDIRLEFVLLVTATALSCVVTYEIVRRVAWLRPWFGLKRLNATSTPTELRRAASPLASPRS
jgi:glucans biosynthesis protein C